MLKRLSETEIQLCGKDKCCPIITKVDEDNYQVTDDHGNTILVKKAELELVTDAIKALDKPKEQLLCG